MSNENLTGPWVGPSPHSGLSFLIRKGWESGGFWRTLLSVSQRSLQFFGVFLLPSPLATLLGPMPPALAGCQSLGEVISWWELRGWSGWRHELVCR